MKRAPTKPQTDSASTFKELLASPTPPTLLLVTADDAIRPRRIQERLIEKFGGATTGVRKILADELRPESIAALQDDRATLSLFSTTKIYLFHGLDKVPAALQKPLADFFAAPATDTSCWCFSAPLTQANPLSKAFKNHGVQLAIEELSGDALMMWVRREFKNEGISEVAPAVVAQCIEMGDRNPDRIVPIVAQLALYLDNEPATEKALAELFPATFVAGEFELVDSIISVSPARSELLFETLVQNGKSPFMLIGMIAKIFSNYHAIRAKLERGVSPELIREELKMTPWVFNKSLTAAKRLRPQDLILHLEAIVRCDSKMKNRSLGAEAIFSELFETLRPVSRLVHA